MSKFDAFKYKSNQVGNFEVPTFDGSDTYANLGGYVISFQHVPTGKSVKFKAFITTFNETYGSDWAPETVFGRVDPIYNFKMTTRTISLAFKVPAFSESEAFENLGKVQRLAQFLYPNYTDIGEAQTISQGPLVRLKVMNLLQNTSDKMSSAEGKPDNDYYESYSSDGSSERGLLGIIDNLTVGHNLENLDAGVFQKGNNTILPKLLEITIGSFKPIHEQHLGWGQENKNFGGKEGTESLFPYGVDLETYNASKIDDQGKTVSPELAAENDERDLQSSTDNAEANKQKTVEELGYSEPADEFGYSEPADEFGQSEQGDVDPYGYSDP
jgi:hypothetical protein